MPSPDRAELIARWHRVLPIIEQAAECALESDIKSGKPTIPATLSKLAESVSAMSDEQFAAFLDVIEAGIPEGFSRNGI